MRELLEALIADREEPTQETQATFNWDPLLEREDPMPQNTESAATTAEETALALDFHPAARVSFDTKGEGLLAELVRSPADAGVDQPQNTDLTTEQLAKPLPKDTVRGNIETFRDAEGFVTARCFVADDEIVGLQAV